MMIYNLKTCINSSLVRLVKKSNTKGIVWWNIQLNNTEQICTEQFFFVIYAAFVLQWILNSCLGTFLRWTVSKKIWFLKEDRDRQSTTLPCIDRCLNELACRKWTLCAISQYCIPILCKAVTPCAKQQINLEDGFVLLGKQVHIKKTTFCPLVIARWNTKPGVFFLHWDHHPSIVCTCLSCLWSRVVWAHIEQEEGSILDRSPVYRPGMSLFQTGNL